MDSSVHGHGQVTTVRLCEVNLYGALTLMLDSLIAFEKACIPDEQPKFWLLGRWNYNVYEFTGSSTFSESALGFTEVMDEIIFIYKDLPDGASKSDMCRNFSQVERPPHVEDYSTWFIRCENGHPQIEKSYTFRCD